MGKPGMWQSMGSQRVRHGLATEQQKQQRQGVGGVSGGQQRRWGSRSQRWGQHLCTQPTAAVLVCRVMCSASPHGPQSRGVHHSHSAQNNLGLMCPLQGLCNWHHMSRWNKTDSKEKKQEKVRLYYPDSFLLSQELLKGFTSDKTVKVSVYSVTSAKVGAASTYYTWRFVLVVSIEGFHGSSVVRIPLPMQEMQVRFLGWKDPLEVEMATHSSIFAWEIPGQRSLMGYSTWGRRESDTTEHAVSI